MGNINTYLNWRGDLGFGERPFCEADNLALAVLSYLELEQIVSPDGKEISIREAYEQYRATEHSCFMGDSSYRLMFQHMASSRRFGSALLSHYRVVFDEICSTQFAAVQIRLGDGSCYISFRGTDNSIVGWEEDFRMGSEIVPAQQEAARYLNEVMQPEGVYRIGGHSKGGNLALYASIHCREEWAPAILAVYNNDGPGLSADIIPAELYRRIDGKLHWIIPEYSIIGTLFPYGAPTKIVSSSGNGLLQHNPFTWEIEGDSFQEKEKICESCQFYVDIFDTWINSADLEHRRAFTQDLFGALKAGGARTIGDVLGGGIDGFGTILLSIVHSESRTRIVIGKFIRTFLEHCRGIDLRATLRSKAALQGGLLLAGGVLLMLFPGTALRLTGALAGGAAILLLGRRILACSMDREMDIRQKKFRILSCLAALIAVEFIIVNNTVALISSHLILGGLLLFFSFRTIYQAAEKTRPIPERVLMGAAAIVAVLLGLVSFTKSGQDGALVFTLGTFFVASGVVLLIRTAYRSGSAKSESSAKL